MYLHFLVFVLSKHVIKLKCSLFILGVYFYLLLILGLFLGCLFVIATIGPFFFFSALHSSFIELNGFVMIVTYKSNWVFKGLLPAYVKVFVTLKKIFYSVPLKQIKQHGACAVSFGRLCNLKYLADHAWFCPPF